MPVGGRDWVDERGRAQRDDGYRRVIVKRDPDEERTAAGIVIPIVKRKHAMTARVVSVHRDERLVAVGDRVLLGQYAGSDVELDGELYTVVPVHDVLAVIEDNGPSQGPKP